MEYYGKILCISAMDLTYDDRPVLKDGELDYSNSRVLNGNHPSMLPDDILAPIMTESNYKQLKKRGQINVVRPGKGLGSYALVEVATLPQRFKDRIKAKYGDMNTNILRDWFGVHYEIDAKAREFFTRFRFADGTTLPPEHINEYTINASVLQAVLSVMNDTRTMRQAMQNNRINWGEMAGAISFYQAEFGHTLPLSPTRFQKRVNEFKSEGYECLISKKFKNQNTRKVNYPIERLILSLDSLPTRPYNTTVAEMYNQFVCGELQVFDPETGEIYNPMQFTDKKGNPLVLSEATIANYLNNPKNKALRAKLHDSQWDFNNMYRPHHLRHSPFFAFSKISMDDRDLPRKMHNGQRVKAYYAYDVASGCIVGYAYNRLKTADLFLDCVRNMFQTIERNGWYMPAQVEVEHHLVNNFADGLMKAGVVFPFVRWCNPGNSQEKRAEHGNRAKKYGVEKNMQVGIGRWYASLEANRPKTEKIYDEFNNTYKEKTYSYEELVADDIAAIKAYNSQKHPNQKLYPGMTRWDVLCGNQNPNLAPYDRYLLARYIGEKTQTTIRRNMYCTVMYKEYGLPDPKLIERLEPRNYMVEAYYLPDMDGNITEVYIYQNDTFIATCGLIQRYNEAAAEQTEDDREVYTNQAKYVSRFDSMIKEQKIQKVGILKPDEKDEIERSEARAAIIPDKKTDDDFSEFMDISSYRRKATIAL